jgi:DNA modification methylase
VSVRHGDLFDVLPTLGEASIDACVTDPPYELAFMGKRWDNTGVAFKVETWREVLRVLKPGAHLVAFGGTRTFHRMTSAIEDAGFEIRDCLSWLYGSGFPKSLNLPGGLGTALKPSWEPIILARKPTIGTVAANVERFGTAALNIDGCRLSALEDTPESWAAKGAGGRDSEHIGQKSQAMRDAYRTGALPLPAGRWPANVVLDDAAAVLLDEQSGETESAASFRGLSGRHDAGDQSNQRIKPYTNTIRGHNDSGGASRFYYVAKPSREERDMGIYDGFSEKEQRYGDNFERGRNPKTGERTERMDRRVGNTHPTVKPVELMRWLVRLVTPLGGTVLDPFTGSGTTGMACRYELREFVGIEREAEYVAIAERRIAAVAPLFSADAVAGDESEPEPSRSGGLFSEETL